MHRVVFGSDLSDQVGKLRCRQKDTACVEGWGSPGFTRLLRSCCRAEYSCPALAQAAGSRGGGRQLRRPPPVVPGFGLPWRPGASPRCSLFACMGSARGKTPVAGGVDHKKEFVTKELMEGVSINLLPTSKYCLGVLSFLPF